jgi:hypothetical protein
MYFEKIDHCCHIAGLARQAGAAAAPEDRHIADAACRDRGFDIVDVLRDHDTDRNLAVDRQVRRIERPAGPVEPHLAPDIPCDGVGEIGGGVGAPPIGAPHRARGW